ncbi:MULTISPECIES: hypothetical protein [Microbacterium]|uniref:hypothetical protein n=1 Tax=Microbacterium TaxID=33882 RepID=UPI00278B0F40|nr:MULTISPECIES: hypothetical protein [Microbacterium]MDQ1083585.1 hypothetical protein [Microbacterium sp. SORGH_AS_0344]MDQ1171139.1 hypothetical protein [Microbacterium proteolyticum]
MSQHNASESAFFGPVSADWTINEFLEWIGADDARCHDATLGWILTAVNDALGTLVRGGAAPVAAVRALTTPARGVVAPVAAVRGLAMRVAAEPRVGERRLAELIDVAPLPVGQHTGREVLLAV